MSRYPKANPKTREQRRRTRWMRAYGRELARILPAARHGNINWSTADYYYLNSRDDGATAARSIAQRNPSNAVVDRSVTAGL